MCVDITNVIMLAWNLDPKLLREAAPRRYRLTPGKYASHWKHGNGLGMRPLNLPLVLLRAVPLHGIAYRKQRADMTGVLLTFPTTDD